MAAGAGHARIRSAREGGGQRAGWAFLVRTGGMSSVDRGWGGGSACEALDNVGDTGVGGCAHDVELQTIDGKRRLTGLWKSPAPQLLAQC